MYLKWRDSEQNQATGIYFCTASAKEFIYIFQLKCFWICIDSHSKPVPVRMVLSTEVQTGHVVLQKQLQKQLGAGAISRFQVLDNKQRPQEMKGIVLHVVTEPSKKVCTFALSLHQLQ